MRLPILLIFSTMTSSIALLGQVDLYLEPQINGDPIATVPMTNSNLSESSPVLDSVAAAEGWRWAEYNTTLVGYIPDRKIGKDLFPVDGAFIHLRASDESPVLTTVNTGDEIEILDTGAWWTVEFSKPIPVYFQAPSATQVAIEPVEVMEPTIVEETPVTTAGDDDLMSILDANIEAGEGPSFENNTRSPAEGLSQQFEGFFDKTKQRLGFIQPKADFKLLDNQDRMIGWVDIRGLILPGSLETYTQKRVIINGSKTYDKSSKTWIIHARNMRLKSEQ